MAKLQSILFLICFIGFVRSLTDYCDLSCGSELNTVCARKTTNCGASSQCGEGFKVIKLGSQEQKLILETHNKFRNNVASGKEKRAYQSSSGQPQAANMIELTWDKDLAYVAQCWTNNCKYEHDKCRKCNKYSYVGQNLAILSTTASTLNITSTIEKMIRNWGSEAKNYNPKDVPKYRQAGKVSGHYTQLVWAGTKQVGCGMTSYKNNEWNNYFFACNYGPGGNIRGTSVYKTGKPASECESGKKSPTYHALCKG